MPANDLGYIRMVDELGSLSDEESRVLAITNAIVRSMWDVEKKVGLSSNEVMSGYSSAIAHYAVSLKMTDEQWALTLELMTSVFHAGRDFSAAQTAMRKGSS